MISNIIFIAIEDSIWRTFKWCNRITNQKQKKQKKKVKQTLMLSLLARLYRESGIPNEEESFKDKEKAEFRMVCWQIYLQLRHWDGILKDKNLIYYIMHASIHPSIHNLGHATMLLQSTLHKVRSQSMQGGMVHISSCSSKNICQNSQLVASMDPSPLSSS